MDFEKYIQMFFNKVENNAVEIYNEFSLQHELGLFLRNVIPKPMKVEFERNIGFFNNEAKCVKSEIDIVIYSSDKNEKYAIELKLPKNGQYPESMFNFIKDIQFMEQVKQMGFTNTYAVTYVQDKLYYSGSKIDGIYAYFRNHKALHGEVSKPTGQKDEILHIQGNYQIDWFNLGNGGVII
ncbi:hypothetical protein [Halobacillus amylolyticus]|uniref:Uncharacterized protein n=1 Tax=Halobacillus amylolyticus TaxID=2932259 RepID=A0ABY4HD52_9BACI|nr:hypothetical protein [Halobacillus amylolyticus]UOR12819.1 hypothetical protein MUO15_04705 [Halobacillus amylolyticus]